MSASKLEITKEFCIWLEILIEMDCKTAMGVSPSNVKLEKMVRRAFILDNRSDDRVRENSNFTAADKDLDVDDTGLSVKSEYSKNASPNYVKITKLCTVASRSRPWDAQHNVDYVLEHLSRYKHIIMVRTLSNTDGGRYHQLVDISPDLLAKMSTANIVPTGRGVQPPDNDRPSLGGDVMQDNDRLFRVLFDSTASKCVISYLPIELCNVLSTWSCKYVATEIV